MSTLRLMTSNCTGGGTAGFERLLSTCSRTLEHLHIDAYFEVQSYIGERLVDNVYCDSILAASRIPPLPRLRTLSVDQLLYCTEYLVRDGVRVEDLFYTLPGGWFQKLIKQLRPPMHDGAMSSFEEMVIYLELDFSESDEVHPNWANTFLSVFHSPTFAGVRSRVTISDLTPTRHASTTRMLDDIRQSTSFKQLVAEGNIVAQSMQ
ncbi:unnamed protein product [Cyclocybe aegerita]|uniref:Uncharacterized protein n=1 Tax=Cyclocybe aegerita TaxID=1973307 RepID=A0A8S0X8V3_CYCAE|nr:unnamed protein product [Cyclocybe aegerita]